MVTEVSVSQTDTEYRLSELDNLQIDLKNSSKSLHGNDYRKPEL